MSRRLNLTSLSRRQASIALLFGCAAAAATLLPLAIPIGIRDMQLDLGEVFVTLGAALGGPIGGLMVGFLKGISYSPERNVPSHMLAGFVWGIWYTHLWKFTADHANGKRIRIALWAITVPFYYYVLLLPLYLWIQASLTQSQFTSLFMEVAPLVLPEIVTTIIITGIILLALPDKYSMPT
jgi:hypothetical protein